MNLDTLADELSLAEELLRSGVSSGVVRNGVESRSGGEDSRKYQQGGSDLQPLGVAAGAKQELTIYASGIPAGQKLTVYASQFHAEASAWKAEIGKISNGRNVLTVPQIGSQNTSRGGQPLPDLRRDKSGGNPPPHPPGDGYSGTGAGRLVYHERQPAADRAGALCR